MIHQASFNRCSLRCERDIFIRRLVVKAILFLSVFCDTRGLLFCAEQRSVTSRGIDVILLIDVSGSMADKDGQLKSNNRPKEDWNGSDPDRMRWDAVKLLVDLLDSRDRVLIRRFNEECPARFEPVSDESRIPQFFPDGSRFVDAAQDFPAKFTRCGDKQEWDALISRIGQFNKRLKKPTERTNPNDDGWTLDQGGTNIIAALESLEKAVADEPSRKKRVILLTDGCDNDIDSYVIDPDVDSPKINSKLAQKISFLKAANISVFTVGLKLDNLDNERIPLVNGKRKMQRSYVKVGNQYERKDVEVPHFQQAKARALLKGLSELTGGEEPIEAKKATDLLPNYRDLIYKFKGLWQKIETVDPGTTLSIPVSNAIYDFRMLAFVTPEKRDSSKAVTNQPKFAGGSGAWVPAAYAKSRGLGTPQLRQGTEEKLYALWYGGNIDPNTNENPFADIDDEVQWSVPIPNELQPVETTQFKQVPEEFGWPPEVEKSTFYRHQRPNISLRAARDRLNAQDFEWNLLSKSASGKPAQFEAQEGSDKIKVAFFVAGEQVSNPWKSETPYQDVVWKLSARGIKSKNSSSTVLAGFEREFPQWAFRVKNELPLRFRDRRDAISLSLTTLSGGCEITTQFEDAVPTIPMQVTFIPPSASDARGRLPIKLFRLNQIVDGKSLPVELNPSTGQALFELIGGNASIKIELLSDQKELLPTGAEFTPGNLIFKSAVKDLRENVELKIPVELAIERPILQFFKDESRKERIDAINGLPTTGIKTRQEVFLAPKDDSGNGDKITIGLEWITHPIGADRQKTPLTTAEFHLTSANGNELQRNGDVWVVNYTDRSIPIVLETHLMSERLAESLAEAKLVVKGDGFTTGVLNLNWKFKPREVAIKLLDEDALEVEPGQNAIFRISGRITNHTDSLDVTVAESIQRNGLTFYRIDKPNSVHDFSVSADAFRHIKAVGTSDKSDHVSTLTCPIPSKVEPGVYEATLFFDDFFTISKQRVPISLNPKNGLTLKLIVDWLKVEVSVSNKDGEWGHAERLGIGQSEFTVFGNLEESFERYLRITSALGRSFDATNFPTLESRYELSTDAGRQAIGTLEVKPVSDKNSSKWLLEFPPFNNRDKKFPFVAELIFDREQRLKQSLRLKIKLLKVNN